MPNCDLGKRGMECGNKGKLVSEMSNIRNGHRENGAMQNNRKNETKKKMGEDRLNESWSYDTNVLEPYRRSRGSRQRSGHGTNHHPPEERARSLIEEIRQESRYRKTSSPPSGKALKGPFLIKKVKNPFSNKGSIKRLVNQNPNPHED